MKQRQYYAICLFSGLVGYLIADLVGWDLVSYFQSGSTSPDWALKTMNADAENAMNSMINTIGAVSFLALAAVGIGSKGVREAAEWEEMMSIHTKKRR